MGNSISRSIAHISSSQTNDNNVNSSSAAGQNAIRRNILPIFPIRTIRPIAVPRACCLVRLFQKIKTCFSNLGQRIGLGARSTPVAGPSPFERNVLASVEALRTQQQQLNSTLERRLDSNQSNLRAELSALESRLDGSITCKINNLHLKLQNGEEPPLEDCGHIRCVHYCIPETDGRECYDAGEPYCYVEQRNL